MIDNTYCWGTGRRKSSVARVRIKKGTGKILFNSRDIENYFVREVDRATASAPLRITKTLAKYDVWANIDGGGNTGQAGAVSLGLARALCKADESLTETLKNYDLMTRDSRMKERKKYGRKGARAGFQWTKR
ncbi:MAG: 30S ribosomal protein S9 [Candidatus Anammoxibacter sp.]